MQLLWSTAHGACGANHEWEMTDAQTEIIG